MPPPGSSSAVVYSVVCVNEEFELFEEFKGICHRIMDVPFRNANDSRVCNEVLAVHSREAKAKADAKAYTEKEEAECAVQKVTLMAGPPFQPGDVVWTVEFQSEIGPWT
ncbi:hypothetical protein FOA52_013043 [Chlamydomonas sp. UWO 241]|nr:hypothetical protein FOA52_013043 [Chlamydomonas sp. UWO 241]